MYYVVYKNLLGVHTDTLKKCETKKEALRVAKQLRKKIVFGSCSVLKREPKKGLL